MMTIEKNKINSTTFKKIKFISSKCGSGKGIYMRDEIKKQLETDNNHHIIVMPTKKLIEQFKGYFSDFYDNVIAVVSSDEKDFKKYDKLLPRINSVIYSKSSNILMVTEKMFYRIDPLILRDWNVWIDDCNKFCDLKIKGIRKDDKKELLSIYNKLFITSDSFVEISSIKNDPVNFKYKSVKINDKIELSEDIESLLKLYQEMSFYHQVVVLYDSLIGKAGQLVIAGWYDLSKYVDEGISITYMSNEFESSLLYKRWSYLFEEVKIEVKYSDKIQTNDNRIDVKYFFDCTKKDRGLSKGMMCNGKLDSNVRLVMEYLKNELKNIDYYWTTNDKSLFTLGGNKITPNQRGMNHLMDKTVSVFMAAMNAHPNSAEYLRDLFNFTTQDIVEEYEFETMYQFIYRSVVRDYSSSERVIVYVFDSEQAYAIPSGSVQKIDLGLSSNKKKTGSKEKIDAPLALKNNFKTWKSRNNNRADTFIRFNKWVEKVLRSTIEWREEDFYQLRKTLSVEKKL
ncbi:TPA: DEAD/DEAH box helicase family protein [Yersinia enterocolitica]